MATVDEDKAQLTLQLFLPKAVIVWLQAEGKYDHRSAKQLAEVLCEAYLKRAYKVAQQRGQSLEEERAPETAAALDTLR
jgi:hypothetical protein